MPTLGKLDAVPQTVGGLVKEGESSLVRKAHLDNFWEAGGVKQAKCVPKS
jgi:hypothetical protein